ncbi:hypothetical protein B0J17DRAFT_632070 [Rhizoctonia solani]|nr:hypothetical protein B0J17DRAFT_632070 [Rhizoctonia solani]
MLDNSSAPVYVIGNQWWLNYIRRHCLKAATISPFLIGMIRLVGRVTVNIADRSPDTDSTDNENPTANKTKPFELRLEGTPLCLIDVTVSHVAVMYAVGYLLDSIRKPFNASIIRAEMDLLRGREGTSVSPEDYEKWKKENYEAKCIDPLVSAVVPDPKDARGDVPQCPYLCQLLFKSFSVGGKPGFGVEHVRWFTDTAMMGFETSEEDLVSMHLRNDIQAWLLYIDVSNPLRPRYAFIEKQNIIDSTRSNRDESRKPLYIFNAREHTHQLMIPESEFYSDVKRFGEQEWERHTEGITATGRRRFIQLPDDPNIDPDYKALLVSRMRRAREHPAVMIMTPFDWFTAADPIKVDGSALLQGIWRYSLKSSRSDYHRSIVHNYLGSSLLLDEGVAEGALIIRSQAMNELDHPDSPELEYSFKGLPELASDSETSLKSVAFRAITSVDPSNVTGGILSLLDNVSSSHTGIFPVLKLRLAQNLKDRSSKGGTGFHEEAFQWLSSGGSVPEPRSQPPEESNTWLKRDYDTSKPHETGPTVTCDEEMWWVLACQGFCYRASVAQERLSMSLSDQASSGSISASQSGPALSVPTNDLWEGEFPGRPLGDVAHPAFDASYFPRISEHQLLNTLQIWFNTIWLPDLKAGDWDFDHSIPVPLRTLNVSGCHFVTRNTIRRALQIAPTVTRIIMIGCENFGDADLMLVSLDGTLNNIECILNPTRHKREWRDDAYNRARKLIPQPPNEKVQAKLHSVPGVFLNSTEEFEFHLARPPALGFDSTTVKIVCGPPRFSVILATHSVTDTPVTGATLPRVPIDTGIQGIGTNGCSLTSIWRSIIDLLELLGDPYIRNKQR